MLLCMTRWKNTGSESRRGPWNKRVRLREAFVYWTEQDKGDEEGKDSSWKLS